MNTEQIKTIALRLPNALLSKLEERAGLDQRSMNSQAIFELRYTIREEMQFSTQQRRVKTGPSGTRQFALRTPPDLWELLKVEAGKASRSVNREVELRLTWLWPMVPIEPAEVTSVMAESVREAAEA